MDRSKLNLRNNKIEGECTIKAIYAVRLNETLKWIVLCLSIVPFLGVPLLLMMWFPSLKQKLYYSDCELEEATHLWVVNADEHEEEVDLEYGQLVIGLNTLLNTYHFTNRLLKYYQK